MVDDTTEARLAWALDRLDECGKRVDFSIGLCRSIQDCRDHLSTAVSPTPANALHDGNPSPDHAALVEEARAEFEGIRDDQLSRQGKIIKRLAAALHPSAEGGADKT